MSPALAGGFLTTAPPGKPQYIFLNVELEAIKNVNFLLRTSITLGNLF